MTGGHGEQGRLPDRVLAEPEPTRARHPDDQGWVVDEQGVRVFYEVYGDSDDVVCLLPPWGLMNSRFWRMQIAHLSRHFGLSRCTRSTRAVRWRGGGRLHVFEGRGPNVTGRWPVAMNLVLREFFESVRSGVVSAPAPVEA